jgi:hypothetical protein
MLLPKSLSGFFQRNSLTLPSLLYAPAKGGHSLRAFEPVEHQLVAFSVLNDKLGAAVDGQHEGRLLLLQTTDVVFDVTLELGDGTDFSQVDHGRTSIMFKADNSTLSQPGDPRTGAFGKSQPHLAPEGGIKEIVVFRHSCNSPPNAGFASY